MSTKLAKIINLLSIEILKLEDRVVDRRYEHISMSSNNFQLLEARWPQLYKHANLAEQYSHNDPHTSIVKLRCFAEQLVGILFRELDLPCERNDGFFDKLTSKVCTEVIDDNIIEKLHAIRILGNKAAHGKHVAPQDALSLLYDAYLIGQWLFKTYSGSFDKQYPAYKEPHPPSDDSDPLLEKNANLEKQLQSVKDELEQLQKSEQEAQSKNTDLQKTLDEVKLQNFKEASSNAAASFDISSGLARDQIDLDDAFSEYTLTDDQKMLVENLGNFLTSKNDKVFLLKGYAGTGKTFITKGLTEYFRSIGRNFILAAPTGKASKVISEKTKCSASTIHKAIYSFKDIAEYRDNELDGSETYKYYAQLAVNNHSADTVFIVDEASMVSDVYQEEEFFRFGSGYLLQDFLEFVNLDHNDHKKKIIFIGDDAQLPPVGMTFSPALDQGYLKKKYNNSSLTFELQEVVRQKTDSGVISNSIKLRESLEKRIFNQLTLDLSYPDIEEVSYQSLIESYLSACDGKINAEAIILAHSNADVAAYNRRIREHFFPNEPKITGGDKIMAVSNSYAYGIDIFNGDFGLVRKVSGNPEQRTRNIRRKNSETGEVEEIDVLLTFRDVNVGFKDLEGISHFFDVKIVENLLYSDHPGLSSDESKALYLDFCIRNPNLKRNSLEFKEVLRADPYFNALRVKFGYAITCHKAQGSEWNNVFVKCKTHQSQLSSDYFRWLYTAITRTTKKLFLLEPPNLKIGTGIKAVGSPNSVFDERESSNISSMPIGSNNSSDKAPGTADEQLFGIPSNAHFSVDILRRVRSRLENADAKIQAVELKQYQDIYFFKSGDEIARIDIRYNGKQKITTITTPQQTELSLNLIEQLSPLKGEIILRNSSEDEVGMDFGEEFLNDLHQRLCPIIEEKGITIRSVEQLDWSQRYTFDHSGERAVIDIFYNGKKRFTKCSPVKNACTSNSFSNTIMSLITEELS